MAYVSFFEQLTSSVSLSVLAIVSTGILGLLLVSSIVGRLFSASKSKTSSVSVKNVNTDKPTANKKKHTKAKKPVATVSTSSPNTQSEESENEKVKPTAPIQTKKPTKPTEKVEKSTTKVNTNKKQPVVAKTEVKQTPIVDVEIEKIQEDEGQWVTQNTKQVNNRHRNKNKVESSPSNRKTTSEKAPVVAAAVTTTTTANENEFNDEPIEICQLLPKNENRYTASDKWWKQPLNNQQTFSIDDIGEWPEYEQDEQYIVQVKRIQPTRK